MKILAGLLYDKSPCCAKPAQRSARNGAPNRRRLISQFAIGIVWLSIWAVLVSVATQTPFWIVLPAMLALALAGGAITLFWMARWAERDAPGGQFGIASLFLIMAYAAVILACVRWVLVATRQVVRAELYKLDGSINAEPTLVEFGMASVVTVALLVISLPCLMGLLDSVMWCVVWLVRRPSIQRILAMWRRPSDGL
jgi:hypothetical protein